jgi:hypothetical protein
MVQSVKLRKPESKKSDYSAITAMDLLASLSGVIPDIDQEQWQALTPDG